MTDPTAEPETTPSGEQQLEQNLRQRSTWLRLLFMLLFLFLWGVSRLVTAVVVVVQFFWVLITGRSSQQLLAFGQALATYSYLIVLYLTFNTERRPFPFDDWVQGPPPSDG